MFKKIIIWTCFFWSLIPVLIHSPVTFDHNSFNSLRYQTIQQVTGVSIICQTVTSITATNIRSKSVHTMMLTGVIWTATFIDISTRKLITIQQKTWVAVTSETGMCVDTELLTGMLAGCALINVITAIGYRIVSESRRTNTVVRSWSVLTLIWKEKRIASWC